MRKTTFEQRLDDLFNEAIGVNDTIWYSETETLRDAIVRTFKDRLYEIFG